MTLTEIIGIIAACIGIICAVVLVCMVIKQAYCRKNLDSYKRILPEEDVVVSNAIYSSEADAIYASLDGGNLDYSYCVESAGMGNISLMWNEQGYLRGVEIYDFKKKYHSLPALVKVKCSEGTFNVVITQLNGIDIDGE